MIKEERFVLTSPPSGQYLNHVTPSSGRAEDVSEAIWEVLEDKISEMMVLGCDSTAVNTEVDNGIIHRLEKRLGRPLQWSICLLHTNDMPLRHLFTSVDGKTTSAKQG